MLYIHPQMTGASKHQSFLPSVHATKQPPPVFPVVECGHTLFANKLLYPLFSVFKLIMLQAYFLFSDTNSQSNFGCFFLVQFYTFLVTTLVTSLLLPLFLAFFTVGEKNGTPEIHVATFVTFGKLEENLCTVSIFISFHFCFLFLFLIFMLWLFQFWTYHLHRVFWVSWLCIYHWYLAIPPPLR